METLLLDIVLKEKKGFIYLLIYLFATHTNETRNKKCIAIVARNHGAYES